LTSRERLTLGSGTGATGLNPMLLHKAASADPAVHSQLYLECSDVQTKGDMYTQEPDRSTESLAISAQSSRPRQHLVLTIATQRENMYRLRALL
jgi:hypothetical protein